MAGKPKVKLAKLKAMLASNTEYRDIAAYFGVSLEHIYNLTRKKGLREVTRRGPSRAKPVSALYTAPPSHAMLALAEHDPIVARALRLRQGLEPSDA